MKFGRTMNLKISADNSKKGTETASEKEKAPVLFFGR